MTVDDIGREHVSCVRVRIAKEVGKAHGWEWVIIIEGAFEEFDHDLDDDLMIEISSWQMMKPFKSTHRAEAGRQCASAGNRRPQTSMSGSQSPNTQNPGLSSLRPVVPNGHCIRRAR